MKRALLNEDEQANAVVKGIAIFYLLQIIAVLFVLVYTLINPAHTFP